MRRCPTCQRGYEDGVAFCLEDGAELVAIEARTVADLIGPKHPPERVVSLLRAAARALDGFAYERLQGALLPEDLELVDEDREDLRVLVSVDLDARRRDDPAALARRVAVQPPEALRGEASASTSALVYGLGCIGYALLEGALPFQSGSPAAARVRKLLEAPPRAEAPEVLAALLHAAMSATPEGRPGLARFLDLELPATPRSSSGASTPPPPFSAAPTPMAAAPAPAAEVSPAAPSPSSAHRGAPGWRWAAVLAGLVGTIALVLGGLSLTFNERPRSSSDSARPASAPSAPTARAEPQSAPVTPTPQAERAEQPAEPAPVVTPRPTPSAPAPVSRRRRSRTSGSSPTPPPRRASRGAPGEGAGLLDGFGSIGRGGGGPAAEALPRRASPRARVARPSVPPPPRPDDAVPAAATRAPSVERLPQRDTPPAPAPPTVSAAEPLVPVAPPASAARPRATPVLPWVLIGSGSLLGIGLLAGLLLGRRRRVPRRPAPLEGVTTPDASVGWEHTIPAAPATSARRCVTCSGVVPVDARFCPFDGSPVDGTRPDHVSKAIVPQSFRVGPYDCIEALGEGGMGVVYRARHVERGQLAAVKVLLPGAGLDPARVELFRREARLAASVKHPNSIEIYDFGELQGQMLYLAMELVEGRSLDEVCARQPLAPPRVARIVRQLGDALDAAHRAGVIHRDLKPANVMITGDDVVKVVDFGIARSVMDPRRTGPGHVMGTLGYMAPEQARGDADLDARADVFALGVVAYELLTGALPFDDRDSGFHVALMRRMALAGPPPSACARVSTLPAAVDECLAAALEAQRERRTATAGAFARSLALALDGAGGYGAMRVG